MNPYEPPKPESSSPQREIKTGEVIVSRFTFTPEYYANTVAKIRSRLYRRWKWVRYSVATIALLMSLGLLIVAIGIALTESFALAIPNFVGVGILGSLAWFLLYAQMLQRRSDMAQFRRSQHFNATFQHRPHHLHIE